MFIAILLSSKDVYENLRDRSGITLLRSPKVLIDYLSAAMVSMLVVTALCITARIVSARAQANIQETHTQPRIRRA
jgi:hypothetical protein